MQVFTMNDSYELIFTINGRMIPVQAVFTGHGCTINGVEFGRFERTKNDGTLGTYLVSKEGYQSMQQNEWEDAKPTW